jgi:2-succinyl-6-hydroxy-2,4-cyclohexadiene-1-carboxylate synthase
VKRAFLHGFLGDPSVWDGFAGDVVSLPGHRAGEPVWPTWAENLDAIATQVSGCDLAIGYSFGARIALGLLAMGAVPRAVLISVNPGIEPDARETRRANDRAWAARFRSEPLADVLDAWEAQPLFATQTRVAPDVLRARRERRLALDPEQIARSLEVMGLAEMPDYRATIYTAANAAIAIRARCTLVVGADDVKFLAIARGLPAPLHVIANCGHDPLLEQPEALAKVLASIA